MEPRAPKYYNGPCVPPKHKLISRCHPQAVIEQPAVLLPNRPERLTCMDKTGTHALPSETRLPTSFRISSFFLLMSSITFPCSASLPSLVFLSSSAAASQIGLSLFEYSFNLLTKL